MQDSCSCLLLLSPGGAAVAAVAAVAVVDDGVKVQIIQIRWWRMELGFCQLQHVEWMGMDTQSEIQINQRFKTSNFDVSES
jgi:hypothetical protein